ncbi:MAG: ABC transporter ATP-binding protein [Cyanobacteria bacterium P01_A01_bin.15]
MDAVSSAGANPTAIVHRPVIVKTEDLSKTYRTGFWLNQQVASLQRCSLTVYQGETFGLLGPNGAGKTTLLKLLLGIIRPTSGSAQLFNQPAGDQTIKQQIGYLPENPYFYDYLTGWEFLAYSAGLFNIPASLYKQRIPELLDRVGLSRQTAIKKQLRQYSKGMLQRIGMAQALINDPDIIFLDEPMSGLDPVGRYQVREVILSLKKQGKTIFFNSHVLSDVEVICDRIAILDQGSLIAQGSLYDLLGAPDAYFVKGQGGSLDVLKKWLHNLTFEGGYWQGYLPGSPYDFIASVRLMNGTLITLDLSRLSLEEFFIEKINQR